MMSDDNGKQPSALDNALRVMMGQFETAGFGSRDEPPIHQVVLVKGNDNQLNVPADQAAIFTTNGGHEIRFVAPRTGDRTDMVRFLHACYVRAEEELGWWEDVVKWLDEYER
jgi:hypothetical protein